jgi:hypothetical protein
VELEWKKVKKSLGIEWERKVEEKPLENPLENPKTL